MVARTCPLCCPRQMNPGTRRWAAVWAPPTLSTPTKLARMPILEFDPPDRFVAGTVGPPRQRSLFLPTRGRRRVAAVLTRGERRWAGGERVPGEATGDPAR